MDPTSEIMMYQKTEKLSHASQWARWMANVRLQAQLLGIWEYVDPDLHEEPLIPVVPSLVAPITDGGNVQPNNEYVNQLEYRRDILAQVTVVRSGLAKFNVFLMQTIAPEAAQLLTHTYTVYQKMRQLKVEFGPGVGGRSYEDIVNAWSVANLPPKPGDVSNWIKRWRSVYDEARSAGYESATPDKAVTWFLRAIKDFDPMWYTSWEAMLQMGQTPNIQDLLAAFKKRHENAKKSSTISKAAFGTWQGHSDGQSNGNTDKSSDTPFGKRPCPCGIKGHLTWRCFTINDNLRPNGYSINQRRKGYVEKAFANDPGFKTWVMEKIQENEAKTGKELVPASASAASVGKMAFSVYYSPNPDQSALDKPDVSSDIPATIPTNMAVKDAPLPLKDSWILDSGSTVHICNDKSRFISYQPRTDNVVTGDAKTRVEGIGNVLIFGRDPAGNRIEITLRNTLYSPGFHVNIVALRLIRAQGLVWDQYADCLADKTSGKPMLKLDEHYGFWTIEHTEHQAYAISSAPRYSRATAEVWHRRTGHLYHGRLDKLANMVDGVEITSPLSVDSEGNPELCQTCQLTKAKRQISRRPTHRTFGRFGRIHFDLAQFQALTMDTNG